jgi:hypothetical protein
VTVAYCDSVAGPAAGSLQARSSWPTVTGTVTVTPGPLGFNSSVAVDSETGRIAGGHGRPGISDSEPASQSRVTVIIQFIRLSRLGPGSEELQRDLELELQVT